MYGGLKDKISEQAEIIIENRSDDIKSQLVEINNRSKEGDQIVMKWHWIVMKMTSTTNDSGVN